MNDSVTLTSRSSAYPKNSMESSVPSGAKGRPFESARAYQTNFPPLERLRPPPHARVPAAEDQLGIRKKKLEPVPGSDSTQMRPWYRSTILLQIASPMPLPEYFAFAWR